MNGFYQAVFYNQYFSLLCIVQEEMLAWQQHTHQGNLVKLVL